jgi:hypothetical protein
VLPCLLEEWRWLLGDSMQLFLVSSMGDMFLGNPEGQVFWLDIPTGRLAQVAGSQQEFKQVMQQRENADEWFIPQLVGDLMPAEFAWLRESATVTRSHPFSAEGLSRIILSRQTCQCISAFSAKYIGRLRICHRARRFPTLELRVYENVLLSLASESGSPSAQRGSK